MCINPDPSYRFKEDVEIILIGNAEAQIRFFNMYAEMRKLGKE